MYLRSFFMWLVPLSFFTYQFILRQWPSINIDELMRSFSVDAQDFGVFSASYYIGYALMQIPCAIMLEKFRPNIVFFLFIMTAAASMGLLLYTPYWYVAIFARFLIGASSAIGFLGVSFVLSQWLRKEMYGRMVGLSFSFGLLGAIYGGKPVRLMIESYGSHVTGEYIAFVGLVIAFLALVLLKKPHVGIEITKDCAEKTDYSKEVWNLCKNPKIVWLAIGNLLLVGSLEGFADVWGVNFISQAYDFTKSDAAGVVSMIFIGMLFGGPILAFFSERKGPFVTIGASGMIMALLFFVIVFACAYLNELSLRSALFTIGILCCYQVVVFTACHHLVSAEKLGISVAFLNAINMLGGSFFHTIIGSSANYLWDGKTIDQCPYYSYEAMSLALSVIPIAAIFGSVIVYSLKDRR
jgi:MFS family permease